MYTFDGDNRLIILDFGVTDFDVSDMYSQWKLWALDDNANYPEAIEVIGGDPTSLSNRVPSYYFTVNGWQIRPHEANHALTVTGNLANDGGIGSPFTQTIGTFNVQISTNNSESPSVQADVTFTEADRQTLEEILSTQGSGGGLTEDQIILLQRAANLSCDHAVDLTGHLDVVSFHGALESNELKGELDNSLSGNMEVVHLHGQNDNTLHGSLGCC